MEGETGYSKHLSCQGSRPKFFDGGQELNGVGERKARLSTRSCHEVCCRSERRSRKGEIGPVQKRRIGGISACIGEGDVGPEVGDIKAVHLLRQVEEAAAEIFGSVHIDVADSAEGEFDLHIGAALEHRPFSCAFGIIGDIFVRHAEGEFDQVDLSVRTVVAVDFFVEDKRFERHVAQLFQARREAVSAEEIACDKVLRRHIVIQRDVGIFGRGRADSVGRALGVEQALFRRVGVGIRPYDKAEVADLRACAAGDAADAPGLLIEVDHQVFVDVQIVRRVLVAVYVDVGVDDHRVGAHRFFIIEDISVGRARFGVVGGAVHVARHGEIERHHQFVIRLAGGQRGVASGQRGRSYAKEQYRRNYQTKRLLSPHCRSPPCLLGLRPANLSARRPRRRPRSRRPPSSVLHNRPHGLF